MFDQKVPDMRTKRAYPSLKPLNAWFKDLVQRLDFLQNWVEQGVPATFWIGGFFFPQGFLTACLQNYARKMTYPIDTVAFGFVLKEEAQEELSKPEDGCYLYGLYLEGARWDAAITLWWSPAPGAIFAHAGATHGPQQFRRRPRAASTDALCTRSSPEPACSVPLATAPTL